MQTQARARTHTHTHSDEGLHTMTVVSDESESSFRAHTRPNHGTQTCAAHTHTERHQHQPGRSVLTCCPRCCRACVSFLCVVLAFASAIFRQVGTGRVRPAYPSGDVHLSSHAYIPLVSLSVLSVCARVCVSVLVQRGVRVSPFSLK